MTNVEFSKHLRLYRGHMKGRGLEEQDAYELAGTEMRLIESRREDEVRPIKRAWRKEDTKNAMARERLWFDRLTRARATVDAFNDNIFIRRNPRSGVVYAVLPRLGCGKRDTGGPN